MDGVPSISTTTSAAGVLGTARKELWISKKSALACGRTSSPSARYVTNSWWWTKARTSTATCSRVLHTVARHVTVAADRKQQLYDHGASEEEIAHRLGLARRNVSLLGAFRCSPYIVPLGAALITDPAEAKVFREQTLTAAASARRQCCS